MESTMTTTYDVPEFGRPMGLLDFMYKYFHLTFIAPMYKTANISWRKNMYNMIQLILLFTYLPTFIGIALGLKKFWGDMEIVTNILVTGIPLMMGFCAGLYFYLYWNEIREFMESIETETNFIHPFVRSKTSLLQIVEDAKRKCKFITNFIVVFEFFVVGAFFLKPFILEYREEAGKKLTEEEHKNNQWKRLIYIMWFPIDISDPEMFYIVYAYQLFTSIAMYCHTATTIPFVFVSARYAAAQFTIVSKALNDIDTLYHCSRSRTKELLEQELVNEPEMPVECQFYLEDSIGSYALSLANGEIQSNKIYNYIRECIQIHQSAIRFVNLLNNLLSPVFAMYVSFLTIALIMATFQLAVVADLDKKFPYFGVVSVTLTDLFAFCWHGQTLINESISVEQAAYNMLWYNHSRRVKQLVRCIIFRSQKVAELKRSGFFNLSVSTYSAILNSSYQWFTVLLKMHGD